MTKNTDKQRQRLVQMLSDDPRYPWEAYVLVREALFYAQKVLEMGVEPDEEWDPASQAKSRPKGKGKQRAVSKHLTGQQLCQAIRSYALEQYGYMAKTVLNNWGLRSTSDFGEIVYNLIGIEEMKKSPTDRREDFDDVFDFDEAFRRNYQIEVSGFRKEK